MSSERLSHAYGTGANVENDQPPQALQRSGYSGSDIATAGEKNWLWGHTPLLFIGMEDASDSLKEGQHAVINKCDPEVKRMGRVGISKSMANAITTPDLVICTSRYIVVAPVIVSAQYQISVLNADDLTEAYAIDVTAPGLGICSDGVYLYVSDGTLLKKHLLATGAVEWSQSITDTLLACDGVRLYCIDGLGADNAINAYLCSDGTADWSGWTESGEEVFGLYSNGLQLFVASYNSGGTSGEMRAVEATTGNGDSGDGGIGTSTESYTWSDTGTNVQPSTGTRIVPAGPHRVAVTGDNSATKIEVFGRLAGGSIATWAAPADVWIASDHRYIYATAGTGSISAFDFDLNLVAGESVTATDLECIASDGVNVYVLSDEGPPDYALHMHARPDFDAVSVYCRESADTYWPLNHLRLHPQG